MNKKLGLAVAGALVAFSSAANAGITIPAGDWTVDIGGNVNAYYTRVESDTTTSAGVKSSAADANTIGTGLLPAAFGIGAKTRQNDLDVAFQFTFFTGTSSGGNSGAGAGAGGLSAIIWAPAGLPARPAHRPTARRQHRPARGRRRRHLHPTDGSAA